MPAQIEIHRPKATILELTVVGDSPLICHRWSEKAKREMLDKQMKKAKKPKAAKDPEADYRASLYEHPEGGYGFPASAFKQAAVSACRLLDDVKMTDMRQAFIVEGELVKLKGEPRMREDMVRLNGRTADIRYRGEFPTWSAALTINIPSSAISPEQVINLLDLAGQSVGVGEWRPEKNGSFGRFHVEGTDE